MLGRGFFPREKVWDRLYQNHREGKSTGRQDAKIAEVNRSLSADRGYKGRIEHFYGSKQFGQKARICHPRWVPVIALSSLLLIGLIRYATSRRLSRGVAV